MRGKTIILVTGTILALSGGTALAGHGKPGLWNYTNTVSMPMPKLSGPEADEMKKMGMAMPGPVATSFPICMTQTDVSASLPPVASHAETGCATHVRSNTANTVSVDEVCNGKLKGTRHIQVTYAGAEHFTGASVFRGTANGQPADVTTSFKGDWVRGDCGKVKPSFAR